jgi:hypothetical protein
MDEYWAFCEEIRNGGKFVAGDPLQSVSKSVRVRDGEVNTTDGPFAETKEQLGGYYLIEADSDEECAPMGRQDSLGQRSLFRRRDGGASTTVTARSRARRTGRS